MEQELRFGLDFGWIWAGLATSEAGFFIFSLEKKFQNILDGENIFGIE